MTTRFEWAAARLQWDVRARVSTATINGAPVTDAMWAASLEGVDAVAIVPLGPSGVTSMLVPLPVDVLGVVSLEVLVRAVSHYMRHHVLTRAELAAVAEAEARYGDADGVRAVESATPPVTPSALATRFVYWNGVERDASASTQLRVRLADG